MSDPQTPPETKTRLKLVHLLPLGFFAVLALIFLLRLDTDEPADYIPSALIGHPAPSFELPPLGGLGLPGLRRSDLDGHVTLVNVFASWCVPCREEHAILEALANDGVRIVGINYKDKADNARRFLAELGNPYAAVGVDEKGRSAIDWGVYGVPETFVVGSDGVIRDKFVGPLTADTVRQKLMPEMETLLGR